MSLAFYRKYRPQNFHELVGQSVVSEILLEALKQGRLSHAYLFSGPRGTGKTSTARLIAKAIQCENPKESGEPCEGCQICLLNARNELVDLVEIDAASNRGIDEIRDLKEKIRFSPTMAKNKVYIIDEVHMLTKEAFNALLKSLEEPPSHVTFILATTELHKIPATILSRCQRYDFKRLAQEDIVKQLDKIVKAEGLKAEEEALQLIAGAAHGGMRDALSLLEQFSSGELSAASVRERLGLKGVEISEKLLQLLLEQKTATALELIGNLHKEGHELGQFTLSFLELLRRRLHESVQEGDEALKRRLLNWAELFDEAWVKLKSSPIIELPLEIAVIKANTVEVVKTSVPAAPAPTPTAPKPVEVQASAAQGKGLHLGALADSIQNPAVRNSLLTAQFKQLGEQSYELSFKTQFHYEKVNHPPIVEKMEQVSSQILGEKIHLKLVAPENPLGWETVEEAL